MSKIFGKIALYSIGSISNEWASSDDSSVLSALDGVSVSDRNLYKFAIAILLDIEGNKTGETSIITGNICETVETSSLVFKLKEYLPNLTQCQRVIVGQVFESGLDEDGGFLTVDPNSGICSNSEGGRLKIKNDRVVRVPGSSLICVSRYTACEVKLDPTSPYGVNMGDNEPDENKHYSALFFSPDASQLDSEYKSAVDYLENLKSINLLINMLVKYRTTDPSKLASVWDLISKNYQTDKYAPNYIKFARMAKFIFSDECLYNSIIKCLFSNVESGIISYWFAVDNIAAEYIRSSYKKTADVVAMMEAAIPRLNVDSSDELEDFISKVASVSRGYKIGNMKLAEKAIDVTISRITDSKDKTKFKKKGQKALKEAVSDC